MAKMLIDSGVIGHSHLWKSKLKQKACDKWKKSMSLQAVYKEIEQQEFLQIPDGWLQGRTIYGGFVAAIMMEKAVQTLKDPLKKLLNVSITFVGPVKPEQVKLTAEILREGKSVTSIEVRLWQDQAVQSILLASFGTERESVISVENLVSAPQFPKPESLPLATFPPLAPECFKQMDMVWVNGHMPFVGVDEPDCEGWMRFNAAHHENRLMTISDLMVSGDMWPPGVLPMVKNFSPASSLTWHLTYINPLQTHVHDWMKYKVITEYAKQGYSTETAYLWDKDDRLIAISRQTITVFA